MSKMSNLHARMVEASMIPDGPDDSDYDAPNPGAMNAVRGVYFTAYHAGARTINPARPWQIISKHGVLCGKVATLQEADRAVAALDAAKHAGTLPADLSAWENANLLGGTR
jgi:hypothetical protein